MTKVAVQTLFMKKEPMVFDFIYHEDLEKRGGLLGGCGMVAHESYVSQ